MGLVGHRLVLKAPTSRPAARRLLVVSQDPRIDLGGVAGTTDAPTTSGATIRVRAAGGDGFDATYDLPATGWRLLGKKGEPKGYRFRGRGPVRSVVVRSGAVARIAGAGSGLAQSLGSDPESVSVAMDLGGRRYCMTFGGRTRFQANRRFRATDAPAPTDCIDVVPQPSP